jgi:hypothetical protein
MRLKGSHLAAAAIVAVCVGWIGSGLIGKPTARPQDADAKAAARGAGRSGRIDRPTGHRPRSS